MSDGTVSTTSLEALEKRLARLEDIEAISRLKGVYADFCDKGYDPDGMTSLFVDDGVWHSNAFGVYTGRQEIYDFIAGLNDEILWATHFMILPRIDIAEDGQSATGRWYLLELASMAGLDGGDSRDAVIMSADYNDTFVKVDGEWKIKRVDVVFHHVSNLDQGWVRQQFRGQ
jgi:hypothetical protein